MQSSKEIVQRCLMQSTINVELKIYDMLGREVAILVNEQQQPGSYEIVFNAEDFSSGIYFYRLISGNFSQVRKMILMR